MLDTHLQHTNSHQVFLLAKTKAQHSHLQATGLALRGLITHNHGLIRDPSTPDHHQLCTTITKDHSLKTTLVIIIWTVIPT